jgi:hypothetical protein
MTHLLAVFNGVIFNHCLTFLKPVLVNLYNVKS